MDDVAAGNRLFDLVGAFLIQPQLKDVVGGATAACDDEASTSRQITDLDLVGGYGLGKAHDGTTDGHLDGMTRRSLHSLGGVNGVVDAGQLEGGFFGLVTKDLLGKGNVGGVAFKASATLHTLTNQIVGLRRPVLIGRARRVRLQSGARGNRDHTRSVSGSSEQGGSNSGAE
ncbi:hypothetical protein D3C85_1021200 [compost metagenome]